MSLSMKWNLDDLYTSFESEEFKADLENLKNAIKDITLFAEKELSTQTDHITKLERYIGMENELYRFHSLSYYCQLIISVDSLNEQAQKYDCVIENLFTDLAKPDVLFKQFVGKIDNLDSLVSQSSILKQHAFILNEIKQSFKYSLSEKEEIAISIMQTTGSGAWSSMKEQLFATLTEDVEINGETKRLPMTAIRNLAYDNCAETRKKAYDAELRAYEKIDKATAAALNSIKGEVVSLSKLRGYGSPLEMTLIYSRMDRKTLDAMFSAIRDYFPVFRKYLRKKAEMLGHINGLPFYDLFAPIGNAEMNFTFDQAADFIYKNFSGFSEKLGAFAKKAFDSQWIDAEIREGKRGGAFCENLHAIKQSRIMANFSGSFNDVLTLAHEIGHAYHGECLNDESPLNSNYTMPIAETASTFCETLICDAALKSASEEEKLVILENDISGATQVIIDIYSRFLFEDEVIKRREQEPLSIKELNEIMIDSQKQAYGDGLDPDYLHPFMWICKPHYYYHDSNYYNFPYAYGQLFSKGLFAEFLQKGDSFVKKYDNLLAATGKNSLEDIAKLAGIDVTSKDFWISSLQIHEKVIEDFCNAKQ